MSKKFLGAVMASLLMSVSPAMAEMDHSQHANHHSNHKHLTYSPIGVTGDHMHVKGAWMLSYRSMHMNMHGSRDGTDDISVQETLSVPNRFFGTPGQPANLRIVPTDMTMDMQMFGGMVAVEDWFTVMAMGMWQKKEMDHVTFNGAGTAVVGTFTTESQGFGDTMFGGLFRLHEDNGHHVHLNLGLSAPTGDIDEEATVLLPNGNTARARMPYAMQLGTGTWDLHPGLTYTGQKNDWNWGAQYKAEIRLEDENSEGYSWGDKHAVTAWAGYQWTDWLNTSARLSATTQDSIDGIDSQIIGPVQTADPDNYGGDVVDFGLGVDFTIPKGTLAGQSLAVEAVLPVHRDLNGPQLETDWTLTAGFRYRF